MKRFSSFILFALLWFAARHPSRVAGWWDAHVRGTSGMAGSCRGGAFRSSAGIGLPRIAAHRTSRLGLGDIRRAGARNGRGGFVCRPARAFGHRDLRDCFKPAGLGGLCGFPPSAAPVFQPCLGSSDQVGRGGGESSSRGQRARLRISCPLCAAASRRRSEPA